MKKPFPFQSGFSILEALIALGIMGIAAAGFMVFLNNAQKGQKNVQQSVEFDMFKTSLNLVFNTKACDMSIRSASGELLGFNWSTVPTSSTSNVLPPGGLPIPEVRHGGTAIAKLNQVVPFNSTSGLKLTRFHIIEAQYDGDQVSLSPITGVNVTYKALSTLIDIEAEKPDGSFGIKKLKSRVSLRLLANPAGNGVIEKCGVQAQETAGIAKAWVTFRNIAGTTTIIGSSYGVTSIGNAAGITNFSASDTVITFEDAYLASNYAIIVTPFQNAGLGSYSGNVLDWVAIANRRSDSSAVVKCAYPGYGQYGSCIASVVVFSK